jgi:hypothetical protein
MCSHVLIFVLHLSKKKKKFLLALAGTLLFSSLPPLKRNTLKLKLFKQHLSIFTHGLPHESFQNNHQLLSWSPPPLPSHSIQLIDSPIHLMPHVPRVRHHERGFFFYFIILILNTPFGMS